MEDDFEDAPFLRPHYHSLLDESFDDPVSAIPNPCVLSSGRPVRVILGTD